MRYNEFLKNIKKCPFCNIKEFQIISERKNAFLIISKAPYHKDHLLVIPKKHKNNFLNLNNYEVMDCAKLLRLGAEILKKRGYKNQTILMREGNDSGKSVSHLHYSIIPKIKIGMMEIHYKDSLRREVLTDEKEKERVSELKSLINKRVRKK